ncbi:hypothetical protein JHK87_035399 [Glycine soja]|nr:hypothetical protein JHK87_035399 [Glycine soja]
MCPWKKRHSSLQTSVPTASVVPSTSSISSDDMFEWSPRSSVTSTGCTRCTFARLYLLSLRATLSPQSPRHRQYLKVVGCRGLDDLKNHVDDSQERLLHTNTSYTAPSSTNSKSIILELVRSSKVRPDSPSWTLTANGVFSTKTTFQLISRNKHFIPNFDWNNVWKWKGPERVRFFLWTVLHHGLKTNFRRRRCGFTKDSSCSFCHLQSEDELHILRDCPFASQVCKELLPYRNISYCWKSFGWKPPNFDWIKANMDGSIKKGGYMAACGSVMRNSQGFWVAGFVRCSVDDLANLGHSFNPGTYLFHDSPPNLVYLLWVDFIGTMFPRRILVVTLSGFGLFLIKKR